ncbi:uncharacterized protein LOC124149873 isoform X2 [Haliotis rufescens]|uniref:uncharacterized protein LOC124149873 isoform X2 n=1 Tax=Haliotis rufescens TaxID=6454 RepID=UPI00201F2899|nr:uncharacterized protein LOC124149873 isoform X2 [Haliotis rufescens]
MSRRTMSKRPPLRRDSPTMKVRRTLGDGGGEEAPGETMEEEELPSTSYAPERPTKKIHQTGAAGNANLTSSNASGKVVGSQQHGPMPLHLNIGNMIGDLVMQPCMSQHSNSQVCSQIGPGVGDDDTDTDSVLATYGVLGEELYKCIKQEFVDNVDPKYLLTLLPLGPAVEERLGEIRDTHGRREGARKLLLEVMKTGPDWADDLVKALRHPTIKMDFLADIIDEKRRQLQSEIRNITSQQGNQTTKYETPESSNAPLYQQSKEMDIIIRRSDIYRRKWQKELFCRTYATTQAMKTLRSKRSVFLTGRSGDGKTSTAYHILEEMMKETESYKACVVSELEEIQHLAANESYIILVNDIFGTSTFSLFHFEAWKQHFQLIEALACEGKVYFIATSPNHIEFKIQTSDIPVLKNIIDMTSTTYMLKKYEKLQMLTEYLGKYDLTMTAADKDTAVRSEVSVGFPQCCKQYVTNQDVHKDGSKFFQRPLELLKQRISYLKEHDKFAYIILLIGLLERGRIFLDTISDPPSHVDHLIQLYGVSESAFKQNIKDTTNKLCKLGYLVRHERDDTFEFSHQSVYDAVCLTFAPMDERKLLEICPTEFLIGHTDIYTEEKTETTMVQIKDKCRDVLIERIIKELRNGECRIIEHKSFCKKEFVDVIFGKEDFTKALVDMLTKAETSKMSIKVIKTITEVKKYTPFLVKLLKSLDQSEEHVKAELLHDILEGACHSGDINMFEVVIARGGHPCENCLMVAAESTRDRPEILRRLTRKREKTFQKKIVKVLVKKQRVETLKDITNSVNWFPFHIPARTFKLFNSACVNGNFKMFQLLEDNIKMPVNTTELLISGIIGGNKQIVKRLLNAENINDVDDLGRTPLHHACYNAPDLCQMLIDKCASLSQTDNRGATPFHMACQTKDSNTLRQLLDLGFQVTVTDIPKTDTQDAKRISPLHLAALNEKGSTLVELLVENGPRNIEMINFANRNNSTALHIASQMPHGDKMIVKLMQKSASHHLEDTQGKTPLHHAAEANIPKNIACLLDWKAKVNVCDHDGKTPLHYALCQKDISRDEEDALADSVDYLLQHHADVNLSDSHGNTALHIAAKHQAPFRIVQKLLQQSHTDVILNKDGLSPLHLYLSPVALLDVTDLLLKRFPQILKTKTGDGRSVLHVALVKKSPYDIVELLLPDSDTKSVGWESINLDYLFKMFDEEQIIYFLRHCAPHFPKSTKVNIMHQLCSLEMSHPKWVEGMNLLDVKLFVSEPDKSGLSVLHKVATSCLRLKYLVCMGANVNITDHSGSTPLHFAVNKVDAVNYLLDNGVFPCTPDQYGSTPLHVALEHGVTDRAVLKKLYEPLMSCSTDIEKFFPFLHTAANFSTKEVVQMIISLQPVTERKLFMEDRDGHLPIHCAVAGGDLEVVKVLTAAMKAARSSYQAAADAPGQDGGSETCQLNLQEIVPLGENGDSLLHVAVNGPSLEIIGFLIKEGFHVNSCDKSGNTPLHRAMFGMSQYDMVMCLLKEGADLNCFNKEGLTPFHIALTLVGKSRNLDFELLLNHGASTTTCTPHDQKTPLHLLCEPFGIHHTQISDNSYFQRMLRLLIEKDCDVNGRDSKGQTPLHVAAGVDNAEAIDILLDNGAEIDAVDNEGKTPLHLALNKETYEKKHYCHPWTYAAALSLVEQRANPHAIVRCGQTPLCILASLDSGLLPQQKRLKKIRQLLNVWEELKDV